MRSNKFKEIEELHNSTYAPISECVRIYNLHNGDMEKAREELYKITGKKKVTSGNVFRVSKIFDCGTNNNEVKNKNLVYTLYSRLIVKAYDDIVFRTDECSTAISESINILKNYAIEISETIEDTKSTVSLLNLEICNTKIRVIFDELERKLNQKIYSEAAILVVSSKVEVDTYLHFDKSMEIFIVYSVSNSESKLHKEYTSNLLTSCLSTRVRYLSYEHIPEIQRIKEIQNNDAKLKENCLLCREDLTINLNNEELPIFSSKVLKHFGINELLYIWTIGR